MVLKREVDVGLVGQGDGGKELGNFPVRIISTLRVRGTESSQYLFHQDQILMTPLLHSSILASLAKLEDREDTGQG